MYRLWFHGLYGLHGPLCPLTHSRTRPLGMNLSEISIKINPISFKKLHLKILSAKICLFRLSLSEFNSLWPSDVRWRHGSGSRLAQVMACCLTAPSHYLNRCWLIINKVHWHSHEGNFTRDTSAISHSNKLENYLSKSSLKSPRDQWVNAALWIPGNAEPVAMFYWSVDPLIQRSILSGLVTTIGPVGGIS